MSECQETPLKVSDKSEFASTEFFKEVAPVSQTGTRKAETLNRIGGIFKCSSDHSFEAYLASKMTGEKRHIQAPGDIRK